MILRNPTSRVALGMVLVLVIATITGLALRSALGSRALDEASKGLSALESTTSPTGGTAAPSDLGSPGEPLQPTPLLEFDVEAAMDEVRALESFGVREGGSQAEADAAVYLRDQLKGIGLDARIEEFPLPDGSTSRNVVARIEGTSDAVIVIGAHMDSKPPSPGANDNASGSGAVLQIAEILAEQPVVPTVEIVFYGSEETLGADPNGHHFGSRYRVSQMSAAERAKTAGMLSVDMIGYGTLFHSRTMGKGPMTLSDMLLAHASASGVGITYLRDPGSTGWSDHEAYELAGIPVSWIEWRDDPVYHSAADTSGHLQADRIDVAGRLVLGFLRSIDEAELATLTTR